MPRRSRGAGALKRNVAPENHSEEGTTTAAGTPASSQSDFQPPRNIQASKSASSSAMGTEEGPKRRQRQVAPSAGSSPSETAFRPPLVLHNSPHKVGSKTNARSPAATPGWASSLGATPTKGFSVETMFSPPRSLFSAATSPKFQQSALSSQRHSKNSQGTMDDQHTQQHHDSFTMDLEADSQVFLDLNLGSFAEDDGPRVGVTLSTGEQLEGTTDESAEVRRFPDFGPSPRSSPRGSPRRSPPTSSSLRPQYSMHPGPPPIHPYNHHYYAHYAIQPPKPVTGDQTDSHRAVTAGGSQQYTFGYKPTPYSMKHGQQKGDSSASHWNPSDPSYVPPASNYQAPPHRSDRALETPEKKKARRGDPFRSPAAGGINRSPFFHGSPAIGNYGSFGIDTPNAMLHEEFSPMETSLEESFARETQFDATLAMPVANHSDLGSGPQIQHRPSPPPGDDDAALDFLGNFSPLANSNLPGVERSPVRSASRSVSSRHSSSAGSGSLTKKPALARSARPSPVRQLYPGPGPSPASGAMRLQLGDRSFSTQRVLDGINSKMQRANQGRPLQPHVSTPVQQQLPASKAENQTLSMSNSKQVPTPQQNKQHLPTPHPYSGPGFRPGAHSYHAPPSRPVQTPQQSSGHPRPPHMRPSPPMAVAPPSRYTPSAASRKPTGALSPANKAPMSAGKKEDKENAKGTSQPKRRGPCNCKKSKCLKLYCECFSAEMTCDGCNCVGCHNTPAYSELREKAIKDIRSKNPHAFKQRIAVNHNMGCRCKKSECLKKYCECFEARVLCSGKCKCTGCMNRAGSQKLIDKRRKMKDSVGADFAMREAEKTWRAQAPQQRKPSVVPPRRVPPMPTPTSSQGPPGRPGMPGPPPAMHHRMVQPSPPSSGPHRPPGYPPSGGRGHPHYMYMGMNHAMGYSPMVAHAPPPSITPGGPRYPHPPRPGTGGEEHQGSANNGFPQPPQHNPRPHPLAAGPQPVPSTAPRTSSEDSATKKRVSPTEVSPGAHPESPTETKIETPCPSSSKRPNLQLPEVPPAFSYFGPLLPAIPRETAKNIFSYLPKQELHNHLSSVNKLWLDTFRNGNLCAQVKKECDEVN